MKCIVQDYRIIFVRATHDGAGRDGGQGGPVGDHVHEVPHSFVPGGAREEVNTYLEA